MIELSVNFYGFGHKFENIEIDSGNDNIGLFAKIKSLSQEMLNPSVLGI